MAHYNLADYPWRPSVWRENEDRDFNPNYKWPHGVPASAMTVVNTADGTGVKVLKVLAPLFRALHILSEEVFNYPLHTASGGYTGGYDNRPIAGSNTPSSHSRATTADYRAVDNPQSYNFTSTWPPALVKIWTTAGFYWGGYYRGAPYDTMHMPYAGYKRDIGKHFAYVREVLKTHGIEIDSDGNKVGGSSSPAPSKPQPSKPSKPAPKADKASITQPGLTVATLQLCLNVCGAALVVDNIIGAATTKAVKSAQESLGVDVDLYVGPKTWSKLVAAVKKSYPLTHGRIFGLAHQAGKRSDGTTWAALTVSGDPRYSSNQAGMSLLQAQAWIRLVQEACQWRWGAPKASSWADGKFESPTATYVKKAQARAKLAQDGMVGPATWVPLFTQL